MFRYARFGLLALIMLSVVSSVHAQEETSPQDQREREVEYLEPIELKLSASIGETASQVIDVPVKITESDGTIHYGYETITFVLSNYIRGDATKSRSFLVPSLSMTYLRCSGNLNAGNRAYTSYLDWHYNGTSVWHDANGHTNHTASSPWFTNGTYQHTNYSYGPVSSIATFNIGYFKNPSAGPSIDDASHGVSWLAERGGECEATGTITLY